MEKSSSNNTRSGGLRRFFLLLVTNIVLVSLLVAPLEWYIRDKHPEWGRQAVIEVEVHDLYNHTMRPDHEQVVPYQDMVLERHYNSWGMSDVREPVVPKPADVYRVLVMGDSFMQTSCVDDSVAGTLERRLSGRRTADGKRIEVLNGGQSSYSPLLHLARFRNQYHRLDPDAVIFSPDLTDVYDDQCRYRQLAVYGADGRLERVGPGSYLAVYHKILSDWGYYAVPLYSYRWLLERISRTLGDAENRRHQQSDSTRASTAKKSFSENKACIDLFAHAAWPANLIRADIREAIEFSIATVGDLVDELAGRGVHLFVFTYPHQDQLTGKFNRVYESGVESLCREKGVAYRSFFATMGFRHTHRLKLYLDDDMHYNADGYRFLADDVADHILSDPAGTLGATLR